MLWKIIKKWCYNIIIERIDWWNDVIIRKKLKKKIRRLNSRKNRWK